MKLIGHSPMKKTGYFLVDRRCRSVTINMNDAVSACDLRRQAKTGSTERYRIGDYIVPTHVYPTPVIACMRMAAGAGRIVQIFLTR